MAGKYVTRDSRIVNNGNVVISHFTRENIRFLRQYRILHNLTKTKHPSYPPLARYKYNCDQNYVWYIMA